MCFASVETPQSKQAFWGGEREGRKAIMPHVQFDKTFLGSKSRNMLQGDLDKRVERMHEQLFSKQKVTKENLQI